MFIQPFSGLIRMEMLKGDQAEGRSVVRYRRRTLEPDGVGVLSQNCMLK